MPGPKLTKEQKFALRKDIGDHVASKTKLAETVKSLSEKYGVGANAIRWHHKKVVGGSAPAKPSGRKPGRPKGSAAKRSARNRKRNASRGRPSSFKTLAAALGKISPADLRRAIRASKLQVKYDGLISRAAKLRRQLGATERRARAFEKQIDRVISG